MRGGKRFSSQSVSSFCSNGSKKMRTRTLTQYEKRIVGARARWKCASCDSMLSATYEVDHIIPLHRGGDDHIDNCQALCRECHSRKTQIEEVERLTARPFSDRPPPLQCTRCFHVLSPYFRHSCVIPIKAGRHTRGQSRRDARRAECMLTTKEGRKKNEGVLQDTR